MTYKEIREWVEDNSTLMPETHFTSEELDHVALCMQHIYEWALGRRPHLGHFCQAIADNNFRMACLKADIPNRKALYLYALFMHNKVPIERRSK